MAEYSALKTLARITEGLKGGPFFKNLPKITRTFSDPRPASTDERLNYHGIEQSKPTDPWNSRR